MQLGWGPHAGLQDEEIVMLQHSLCLALWRLPAASSPAPSASASAPSSRSLHSAALSDEPSASCLTATPVIPPAAPPAASPATTSAAASGGPDAEGASHQPSNSAGQLKPSSWVPEEADAALLAFTYPRYQVYSIARSPDGRFVAVGQSPKPHTLHSLHERRS